MATVMETIHEVGCRKGGGAWKKTGKMLMLLMTLMMVISIAASGAVAEENPSAAVPEVPNYAEDASWCFKQYHGKDVDTFFILPTCNIVSENGTFSSLEEVKSMAGSCETEVYPIFSESTNVYVPLYRQVPIMKAAQFDADGEAYARSSMKI